MYHYITVFAKKEKGTKKWNFKTFYKTFDHFYVLINMLSACIYHVLVPGYIFYYLYNSRLDILSVVTRFQSEIIMYSFLVRFANAFISLSHQILTATCTFTAGECLLLGIACYLFWTGKKAV